MKLRKGSAILVVLGVISLITIIFVWYSRSSVRRSFSTRLMSNEKKAEALAEAAVDLALRYIKVNMNEKPVSEGPTDPNVLQYFRYPTPIISGKLGDSSGANAKLNLQNHPATLTYDLTSDALKPLEFLVDELGGSANVPKVQVECGLLQAEAFTSIRDDYSVVGITVPSFPAQGANAQFLDSIGPSAGAAQTIMSLIGKMEFTFNLPSPVPGPTNITPVGSVDKHKIKIDVPLVSDGEITLTKTGVTKVHADIDVPVVSVDPIDIDFKDIFESYIDFQGKPISLESLFELSMNIGQNKKGETFAPSVLRQAISNRWNDVNYLSPHKADAFAPSPKVVEKGGVFRFQTTVEYLPNGPGGPLIKRVLIADREFKVSDVQPPAPEYSFFVANSNLLHENTAVGPSLGAGIDWVCAGVTGIATITIHNAPEGDVGNLSGCFGGDTTSFSKCQTPGMVRINSRDLMKINTFLGTKDDPKLTEFNALGEFSGTRVFNYIPVFQWRDKMAQQPREHEVDFPVLKEVAPYNAQPYSPHGCSALMNIFKLIDAICAPVLLFGTAHFEYPLGMRLEAPLNMLYSNIKVQVDPSGDMGGDTTEVFIAYKHLEKPYGIINEPAYQSVGDWTPDQWNRMPANLYSTLQYAKKATHFYESETAFKADLAKAVSAGGRSDGGVYDCTGVTYVKGNLSLPSGLKVKGKGILVVKGNITVSGNIERADTETVFSLIARQGAVLVNPPCQKIQASVFSNYCLQNAAGAPLTIDGNLIMNQLDRTKLRSVMVSYNSAACRISPLAIMRDVGKFEPNRYYASLGKGWNRFEFQKQ